MQAKAEGPTPVLYRRAQALGLALITLAVSAAMLASCGDGTPADAEGFCTQADGAVQAYKVLKDECKEDCEDCTWLVQEPTQLTGTCSSGGNAVGRRVTEAWCTQYWEGGSWTADRTTPTPPDAETAQLYRIPVTEWQPIVCGDTNEVAVSVPAGSWIEWPISWIAADTGKAYANWEFIRYQMEINGTPEVLPDTMEWQAAQAVSFECGARKLEGISIGQLVYLPPLTAPTTVKLTYSFTADVNDGWSTYANGSSSTYGAVLTPDGAPPAPATADSAAAPGN